MSFVVTVHSCRIPQPTASADIILCVDTFKPTSLTSLFNIPYSPAYTIGRRFFFHEKELESWGCGLSATTTKIWEHHTMNITYE